MKKLTILTFILIGSLSCSSSKTVLENGKGVGIRQKSMNPNIPYIYINGYKNIEIKPVLIMNENDSTYINELRFNAVSSSMYTKKLMYDKYGIWDKEVWPKGATRPILIWKKRKLIKSQNELFSIAANGTESMEEMFASVIVLDSKNLDCLTETSIFKEPLINYFSSGIRNLNSNGKFYNIYSKMVKEHNNEK